MRIEHMQYGLTMRMLSTMQAFFPRFDKTPTKAPLKLYQNIHKLPLSVFIDCLVDNDYEKLIIEGEATHVELFNHFETLYMQYIEAAGGKDAVNKLYKTGRLVTLRMQTGLFAQVQEALKQYPTEEMFMLLYDFPQYNPPLMDYSVGNIEKVLKPMIAEWKSDLVDLANLEAAQPKEETKDDNPGYSHTYFMTAITGIEHALKVYIPENITVGKFCSWVVRYKEYVRAIELQNTTKR